ncbi:Hint domain-containing protein [Jannaschia rubra]|uniref:Hint domain-containing protein n=1 Tax=Jannaschia rubra TaxID=282197 RepID=UPI002490FD9D|nr:Hint domain-containing protein [Jannaschia rubra]
MIRAWANYGRHGTAPALFLPGFRAHTARMASSASPRTGLSRCMVYPADALRVETGALMGDPMGGMGDVVAGDVYVLRPGSVSRELVIARHGAGMAVTGGSSVGVPGQAVLPLARHQIMGERGATVEVLVLDVDGTRLVLPLGPLSSSDEYTLIASKPVAGELGHVSQVSFARGTRVTMANGLQVRVEDLAPGDRVLTRDNGAQPVRWIGTQTVRAEGSNAPVVIAAGALNNTNDLRLSPDHRLFIYQRHDAIGAGRAEVLLRARHLVNGDTIVRDEDGHVDYFHLLFDAHEIIYVEGIPAESLLVSPENLAGMGEDLARDLTRSMRGRTHRHHHGVEPNAADLDGLNAAEILRRASAR